MLSGSRTAKQSAEHFPIPNAEASSPWTPEITAQRKRHGKCRDAEFITFPAGLCSRMQPDGTIADLPWQKAAVAHAVNFQRDIVPIYFDAHNSRFFYRFAKWRKKLGIKFNIELIFLPKEMIKQCGATLRVFIGEPIAWDSLDARAPRREAARLRDLVINMAPTPSNR